MMRIHYSVRLYLYLRVLTAVLFTVFMCVILILLLRHDMMKESVEKNAAIADSYEAEIRLYLDKPLRIFESIHSILHEIPKETLSDRQAVSRLLEERVRPFEYFDDIKLIGNDGKVKLNIPAKGDDGYMDLSLSPVFSKAVSSGKPWWSPTFIDPKTGSVSVTLSQAFDIGVIAAYLNLSEMRDRFRKMEIKPGSYITIVDDNGYYLAHPDSNKVSKRETDNSFLDFRQYGKTNEGNYKASYGGKTYLVTASPLEDPNWTVLVCTPYSEVFGVADRAMIFLFFAIGLAFIFTFFFARQVASTLVDMFEKFIRQTTEIANGNYFLHMQHEKLTEFNRMADQFNKMTMEIQSREKVILFNQNRYRSLFANAAVSILELDLSEIAKYLDNLKRSGIPDLAEYFKNHPEEVWKCAEMIRIIDMNRRVQEFLSTKGMQLGNLNLRSLFSTESFGALFEILSALIEGKTSFEKEIPITIAGNPPITVIVNGSVVPGYEKSLTRVLVSTLDITERKMASLESDRINRDLKDLIQTAVNELREKDRIMLYQSRMAAMGEMLRNISHQWRQPLNALGIHIQNLQTAYQRKQLNSEALRNFVERSMNLVLHMSRTIDDFRNFFKPDREPVTFNVKEAVEKALSIIEASYKNNFIRIETAYLTDMKIKGYPNEYSQMLLVILNNAKDTAVERKVKEPLVRITLQEAGGKSVLTVTDNAGGIDAGVMMKIFEPYFTTKPEGTGIGLYMSKMIVENNMGGKLTVQNVEGGAEFRIVI